jgi:hypothetical protein
MGDLKPEICTYPPGQQFFAIVIVYKSSNYAEYLIRLRARSFAALWQQLVEVAFTSGHCQERHDVLLLNE